MNWLQLELDATPLNLADIEAALEASGAVSITLISAAEEPVLEPAPGETPLWEQVRVRALFEIDADLSGLGQALAATGASGVTDVAFVADGQWQQKSNHAVDRVFADRLHLRPKSARTGEAQSSNQVVLYLEPGLAFGSGSHPTTSMCLEWLASNVTPGMRVLDFGCGSGVLGIAAALLGASVVAVDHDAQAIMATRDNAAYNGLTVTELYAQDADAWHADGQQLPYDVVVANILAGPLTALAETFERVLSPGGSLVLSGVLAEQAETVVDAYAQTEFSSPHVEAGWALLTGITAITNK